MQSGCVCVGVHQYCDPASVAGNSWLGSVILTCGTSTWANRRGPPQPARSGDSASAARRIVFIGAP
jgi:hypothetical protein